MSVPYFLVARGQAQQGHASARVLLQRASRELFGYLAKSITRAFWIPREEHHASFLGTSRRAAHKARVLYFWVTRNKCLANIDLDNKEGSRQQSRIDRDKEGSIATTKDQLRRQQEKPSEVTLAIGRQQGCPQSKSSLCWPSVHEDDDEESSPVDAGRRQRGRRNEDQQSHAGRHSTRMKTMK